MDDDEREDDRVEEGPSDPHASSIGRWVRWLFRFDVKTEIVTYLILAGVGAAWFGVLVLSFEEPVVQAVVCFLVAIGLWVLAFRIATR